MRYHGCAKRGYFLCQFSKLNYSLGLRLRTSLTWQNNKLYYLGLSDSIAMSASIHWCSLQSPLRTFRASCWRGLDSSKSQDSKTQGKLPDRNRKVLRHTYRK